MKMQKILLGIVAAASLSVGTPALSGVITFDEFAADNGNGGIPASRYGYLGVTFTSTDDGSTWGGIGNGDPGNWDLQGTNGSIFSGYNGNSYGAGMVFASNINGVRLDVSRSNGSGAGNTFSLSAYLNGGLVGSQTITFGAINSWTTVSLNGVFDELRWTGNGTGFHPYGVDNINWESTSVPEPASLALLGLGLAGLGFARRKKQQAA